MTVRDHLPPAVVVKYYLFTATAFGGLHVPISVLIMLDRGLSYTQVGTLMAVSAAVLVTMEIPMGYVGDRIGRRNSLLVGTALVVLGMAGIGVAHSYWAFFAAKATFALGSTFRSGSGSAWLYDALAERDMADRYAHVDGRAQTLFLGVLGTGALLGGYLADVAIAYPYFVDAIVVCVSLAVLLTAPQTGRYADAREQRADGDDPDLTFRRALAAARETFTAPPLRSFVLLFAFFVAAAKAVNNLFVQPASLAAGLDVAQVGWLYAVFTVVSGTATYFAGTLRERVSVETYVVAAPVVVGCALLAATVAPVAVLPAFVVMRGLRRLAQPLAHQYVNDRLPSLNRATALSVVSMLVQVFAFALTVGGGPVGDALGPVTGVAVLGGVLVAVTLLVRVVDPPGAAEDATQPEPADAPAE